MMKIFRTKNQKKQELKEQSVFGYFTMDQDKFDFYLHHAGMELQLIGDDFCDTTFYKIVDTKNKKYPYILYYEVKPLYEAIDMKYRISLNLSKQELNTLKQQSSVEEPVLHHVRNVMIYDYDQATVHDFFDLPEENIEKVNTELFSAFSMIANYDYVPSPIDGEFGTCYKRIRQ